jgi:LysM repeat protein
MTNTNQLLDREDSRGEKWGVRWWVFGLITLLILGTGLWFRFASEQPVLAPAETVTLTPVAPAPAAQQPSVPVPAESVKTLETPDQQPSKPVPQGTTYTVVAGDTLSHRFGATWRAVCEFNRLADCDRLAIGQVLELPEGVVPNEQPAVSPGASGQGFVWRVVGGAPLKGCGGRDVSTVNEEAWAALGLSDEEKAELRTRVGLEPNLTSGRLRHLLPGERFAAVTFCKNGRVVARTDVLTAWPERQAVFGETFVLSTGKTLVWVRNCHNWVMGTSAPPEKIVTDEPPVVPDAPPAPPAPPVEVPAPLPVSEAPQGFCDILDPHLVVGQEHEPVHSGGDRADSSYLSGALYCLRPGQGGMHGFGAKVQASAWSGRVNRGAGRYEGHLSLIGPSYEWIDDRGWDMEVSAPLLGRLHEEFAQDKYRSRRDFSLIGATAGYNHYARRLNGERWFPETQVFGVAAVPLSRDVSHSWDGTRISDTSELRQFGLYANLGVRQWLYEGDFLSPYAQAGYFLQTPSSESASLRVGIADPERIAGIGIGYDFDLKHGGDPVPAWGFWVDIVKGVQVGRAMYRQGQVIRDAEARGIIVEEKDGYIQAIRFTRPLAAEPVQ